jgi:hypothetical protein
MCPEPDRQFPGKMRGYEQSEEADALRAKTAQYRVCNDILLAVYYYRNSGQVAP